MIPRIRQVQARHYKSIDQAVVDLEPFTVLVGPNGAGKSNFIDALAFIKECLAQSIEVAWERRGGPSIPTRQRGEPATLGLRVLMDLAAGSTADYAFEILAEDSDFAVARESCVIRDRNGGSSGFQVVNGKFVQEIPGIRPRISADRLALFAASALDEFRPLYDFLTSIRYYSVEPAQLRGWQKMDSGDVLKADGSNAAAVLNHLEQLGMRDQDERYERICRLLATVVPGIQAISPASDGTGREAMIEFLQKVGEERPTAFASLETSDGTLRILGLLLAIYQPQAPSVLLIEEPEATIHPAAVEVVTQILLDASQERQVLITTHSPDILDFKEIRDDQIRVVTMEQGRTIIAPMSKASRQAVREHLYTPGELLRAGELGQDVETAKRATESLEIFANPTSSLP
jgi:predicted ATPase